MPGHSKRRQRKRKRSEKSKAETLAKKKRRQQKKENVSEREIKGALVKAVEKAGGASKLYSTDVRVREHARRVLGEGMRKAEKKLRIRLLGVDVLECVFVRYETSKRERRTYEHKVHDDRHI